MEDLYKEIFSDQTSQSSVQSSTTSTVSKNKGSGAESGTVCQTDAGEDGICMSKDECKPPWLSDSRQTGNCIGFLEICCPNEVTQVEVRVPTLTSVGCGHRQPGGLGVKANDKKLEFAYFGEFPWMVGVLTNQVSDDGEWNSNTYKGGGTLIGPRAVLTAAHVVRKSVLAGTPLKVRAGESDTEKDDHYPYIESPVQTIIMHEQFNHKNLRNDIALLVLKEPINANAYIGYTCLPTQGQEAPIVKNCLATGWGKDQFGREGRLQHKLKKIQLPIVPNDECQERLRESRLGEFFKLHSSFLCAGGETGQDTCEGDGGSPLMCPIPDVRLRYTQHGIVAWGVDCAYGSYPGAYVDVADFRDWIDNKMRGQKFDTSTYNFS